MRLCLGTRSGARPNWRLQKWLPGVLAAVAGLAGLAGWASAQQPATMPTPGMPGAVVPIPGSRPAAPSAPTTPAAAPEKTVTVNFKNAPWEVVLDWFATESGLTPIYTVHPTGSVTLQPPKDRKFTMGEVVDLLNEAMIGQKFILIRRQVSFTIHPSDEKLDTSHVPRIELSELSRRGKTELVQVLLPLKSLAVEDTMPEVQKMLTPFGTVSMLARTNTLVIVDTAGNINRIYQTIQEVEGKAGEGDFLKHICKYRKAQDVADTLSKLLTDKDTTVATTGTQGYQPQYYDQRGGGGYDPRYSGGYDPRLAGGGGGQGRRDNGYSYGGAVGRVKSVQIAVDTKGNFIQITAPPEKILLAKKIIEEYDVPQHPGDKPLKISEPELRKYSVPTGTADGVAKTLLAAEPSLRILALPQTNEVMVFATPEEHFKLMGQIQGITGQSATPTSESIPLVFTDPAEMAAKLVKYFPSTTPGNPTIEAAPGGQMAIVVYGTLDQIKQVRNLVETLEGIKSVGGGGNPLQRVIPLPGGSASILAEHLAKSIHDLRNNPVIIEDPNAPPKVNRPILNPNSIPGLVPNPGRAPAPGRTPGPTAPPGMLPGAMPPGMSTPDNSQSSADPQGFRQIGKDLRYISAQVVDPGAKSDKKPIKIQVKGNQLIITSEDTEALDLLTNLARYYTSSTKPEENLFKVIRLKNVLAEEAATELTEIFNGPQQQQQQQPGGRGRGGIGAFFGGGGLGALLGRRRADRSGRREPQPHSCGCRKEQQLGGGHQGQPDRPVDHRALARPVHRQRRDRRHPGAEDLDRPCLQRRCERDGRCHPRGVPHRDADEQQ